MKSKPMCKQTQNTERVKRGDNKAKVHHLLFVQIELFADPIYHPTFQCAESNAF